MWKKWGFCDFCFSMLHTIKEKCLQLCHR
jgi:hypothetical protein